MHSSSHLVVWLFVIMVNTECIKIITFFISEKVFGDSNIFCVCGFRISKTSYDMMTLLGKNIH